MEQPGRHLTHAQGSSGLEEKICSFVARLPENEGTDPRANVTWDSVVVMVRATLSCFLEELLSYLPAVLNQVSKSNEENENFKRKTNQEEDLF